jgi:hypothetical protein
MAGRAESWYRDSATNYQGASFHAAVKWRRLVWSAVVENRCFGFQRELGSRSDQLGLPA